MAIPEDISNLGSRIDAFLDQVAQTASADQVAGARLSAAVNSIQREFFKNPATFELTPFKRVLEDYGLYDKLKGIVEELKDTHAKGKKMPEVASKINALAAQLKSIQKAGKTLSKKATSHTEDKERLTKTKAGALEYVKRNGLNLAEVDLTLQDDEEVVRAAAEENPKALWHASPRLKYNQELFYEVFADESTEISCISEEDRKFIAEIIENDGMLYARLDESLRADLDILMPIAECFNEQLHALIPKSMHELATFIGLMQSDYLSDAEYAQCCAFVDSAQFADVSIKKLCAAALRGRNLDIIQLLIDAPNFKDVPTDLGEQLKTKIRNATGGYETFAAMTASELQETLLSAIDTETMVTVQTIMGSDLATRIEVGGLEEALRVATRNDNEVIVRILMNVRQFNGISDQAFMAALIPAIRDLSPIAEMLIRSTRFSRLATEYRRDLLGTAAFAENTQVANLLMQSNVDAAALPAAIITALEHSDQNLARRLILSDEFLQIDIKQFSRILRYAIKYPDIAQLLITSERFDQIPIEDAREILIMAARSKSPVVQMFESSPGYDNIATPEVRRRLELYRDIS